MLCVDCHAHAFPDALAERAVPQLAAEGGIQPHVSGKVADLQRAMDAAGVTHCVIASIATKPEHFRSILDWSLAIASPRLIPFGSVHPDDPDAAAHVHAIADAGLRGVKLHPYYQKFAIDERRLEPIWRAVSDTGLLLLLHTGFDVAFPHDRICDPARVAALAEAYPKLRLIAAHIGGWGDWEESRRHVIGRPITVDLSASLSLMPPEQARDLILSHPPDRIVWGSDSPWFDHADDLARLRALDLPGDLLERILSGTPKELLRIEE